MKKIGKTIFRVFPLLTWVALAFFLLSRSDLLPPVSLQKLFGNLNPIQIENQLPGTEDWQLSNPAPYDFKTFHYPAIEGYAWTTSVEAGDEVKFSVSTTSPFFSADIYRMGWYQGKGARLIRSIPHAQGHIYPLPSPNADTGLIEPSWPVAFTLNTDMHWVSGMYIVKVTASSGKQSYIPFALRSPRASGLAFIHAVNTDEAYNYWGGSSLYTDFTQTLKAKRAFKVSFDRPFQQDTGAGQFFYWEYPMVRWLEQCGYDVSYLSDVDVQNVPNSLQNHHALLIVGHSEYWSGQMRDKLEMAINKGANLAVFGANTMGWQVRYEGGSSGAQFIPNHILVCYKNKALDPLYRKENSQVTVQFRDDPLYRPEQLLLGAMVGGWWNPTQGGFPWVVADASSWVFTGTGLKNGDSLPGLVGYEYDKVLFNYPLPQSLQSLAASPVVDIYQVHDISNATLYAAKSGARVFNAGTIEWSWGLDTASSMERQLSLGHNSSLVNRAAQQITANILQKFLGALSTEGRGLNANVTILSFVVMLSLFYLFYWVWESAADIMRMQRIPPLAKPSHLSSGRSIWCSPFSRRTVLMGFTVLGGGIAWQIISSSTQGRSRTLPGTHFYTYRGHRGPVMSIAWSPDGRRIVSGSRDSTVQVWDASAGDYGFTYWYHRSSTNAIAWSPDGKRIASASDEGTVQVWDVAKGSSIFTYRGHSGAVHAVAWASDGKYIASGGADKTVQVWNATTGQTTISYYGHSKEVTALAWSPKALHIASASFDRTVQVWDAKSGHRVSIHTGHSGPVHAVAWAPNGKYIASGGADYWPRVWDAATGATAYTYGGHRDHINAVTWSPDGKRIASGSSDHTVQIWDAFTGDYVFTYGGHLGSLYAIAWSPDGQRMASGGDDSTVQLWQTSNSIKIGES